MSSEQPCPIVTRVMSWRMRLGERSGSTRWRRKAVSTGRRTTGRSLSPDCSPFWSWQPDCGACRQGCDLGRSYTMLWHLPTGEAASSGRPPDSRPACVFVPRFQTSLPLMTIREFTRVRRAALVSASERNRHPEMASRPGCAGSREGPLDCGRRDVSRSGEVTSHGIKEALQDAVSAIHRPRTSGRNRG